MSTYRLLMKIMSFIMVISALLFQVVVSAMENTNIDRGYFGRSNIEIRGLISAAKHGRSDMVDTFLSSGNYDSGQLSVAAEEAMNRRYYDTAMVLLKRGAVIRPDSLAEPERLLSEAAKIGHFGVVRYLLTKYGVDVNAFDGYPLKMACKYSHVPVVRILLQHGARVDFEDNEPLMLATVNGNTKIVEMLLKSGADPLARDTDALLLAESNGHLKVAELLRNELERRQTAVETPPPPNYRPSRTVNNIKDRLRLAINPPARYQ